MPDIPEDEYDLGYLNQEIERLRRQVSLLNGHDTLAQFQSHIDEQAAEIERLRAALRWYADATDYEKAVDCGDCARKALEGKDG